MTKGIGSWAEKLNGTCIEKLPVKLQRNTTKEKLIDMLVRIEFTTNQDWCIDS